MKPRRQFRSPLLVSVLLGLLAVSLSGCVFLRLLALKNQLGNFDKNFAVDVSDGVRIRCLDPVLYDTDLNWLGIEAKSVTRTREGKLWHVRWVKEPPPGVLEAVEYDVELFAHIVDRRVVAVRIPERFFQYFPKQLFVNVLRSTAQAKIDRKSRQADVTTETDFDTDQTVPPDLADIDSMLGAATASSDEPGKIRRMFRYRPQTASGGGKPIEVTFHFDTQTGKLRRLVGKLPKGTVSYTFEPPSEPTQ